MEILFLDVLAVTGLLEDLRLGNRPVRWVYRADGVTLAEDAGSPLELQQIATTFDELSHQWEAVGT
jgi:hypothetical protein